MNTRLPFARSSLAACVVVFVLGCAPATTLFTTTAEPAGANCATGGVKVTSGTDTDGNRTLNDAEVSNTAYVCNGNMGTPGSAGNAGTNGVNGVAGPPGAPGTQSLINLTAEAAGTNCPSGGTRVDVGLDNGDGGGTANDGTLSTGEVDSTRYVCAGTNGATGTTGATGMNGPPGTNGTNGTNGSNGTNGTNGTNGRNSLVRLVTEPPGSNCAKGGTRIDVGLDNGDGGGTANDGTLSTGEIDQTTFICPLDVPPPQVWLTFDGTIANATDAGLVVLADGGVGTGSAADGGVTSTGSVSGYGSDRCTFSNGAAVFNTNTVSAPVSIVGSVTLVAWVRTTSTGTFSGLLAQPDPPTNGLVQLYLTAGSPVLEYFPPLPAVNYSVATASITISDDTWHMVVGVTDVAAKMNTIYVDGFAVARERLPENASLNFTGVMHVGRLRDVAGSFTGQLDDVRVYAAALTGPHISDLYQAERQLCR